jgi:hypothetical protein
VNALLLVGAAGLLAKTSSSVESMLLLLVMLRLSIKRAAE